MALIKWAELREEEFEDAVKKSGYNRCDWNTYDLVEYFHDLCPDEQLLGFMSAPWGRTLPTERQIRYYEETFRFLKEAKEAFYG